LGGRDGFLGSEKEEGNSAFAREEHPPEIPRKGQGGSHVWKKNKPFAWRAEKAGEPCEKEIGCSSRETGMAVYNSLREDCR